MDHKTPTEQPKLTPKNLESYIKWLESACDDGELRRSELESTEVKLEHIVSSGQSKVESSRTYLLYELMALVLYIQGRVEESNFSLETASSLMDKDQTFVSNFANDWLNKVNEDTLLRQEVLHQDIQRIQRKSKLKKNAIFAIIGVVVLLSFLGTPIANHFTLQAADTDMLRLAAEGGMNKDGTLYFLRTHPAIVDDSALEANCGDGSSDGYVLRGCFDPNSTHIYLRDVSADLHGLIIVSAAHEMLHAAYAGLSSSDRAEVDKILEDEYSSMADQELTGTMAEYEKSEPGAGDDELHSIFATKYAALSPKLESYYSKYFDRRTDVVSSYTDVQSKFNALESQLDSLNARIDSEEKNADDLYNAHVSAARNGYAYGANVNYQRYSDVFDSLEADIDTYNNTLAQYKQLMEEFNGKPFTSIEAPAMSNISI